MLKCFALVLIACAALPQRSEKPAGVVTASRGAQVRPLGYSAAVESAKEDYEQDVRQPEGEQDPQGSTYALLVGISQYKLLAPKDWLGYADADATAFAEFLASPRGGGLKSEERMKVLTNAEATRDAVRNYVRLYLGRARENHGTFLLVLGAHGFLDEKTGEAHIMTHESDPQDLSTSGLPMDELEDALGAGLAGLGRMVIFVDVCHAAEIGSIKSKKNGINRAVQQAMSQVPGKVFSFVSSRETESSFEGKNWGGGHGAFTYFILRGLNGDAAKNNDGVVSAKELLDYVQTMVKETTRDEQHPKELTVTVENTATLATGSKAQFAQPFEQFRALTEQDVARGRTRKRGLPEIPQSFPGPQPSIDEFETAIRSGTILPGEPGSAYDMLNARFPQGSREYRFRETELRVALENRGQQVVLHYLQGDQVEQKRESFQLAARYFRAALLLARDSPSVEARQLFCQGRDAIFAKNYDDAIRLLDRAARIDPKGAYSFNALGIAYLEQGKFPLAVGAFHDAIRRAPYWIYPRHNLALALAEQGQYDPAIRAYRDALKLGPTYSYLPYNLGLLYQRLNRLADAEQSYKDALRVARAAHDSGLRPAAPGEWREGADIYNALGSLEAEHSGRRHRENAEKLYRQALQSYTGSHPARHNLALLLSRTGESAEAEQLWRKNLMEEPGNIASRLALARYLSTRPGREEEAVREYLAAIGPDGSFPGIRRELSVLSQKIEALGDQAALAGQSERADRLYRIAETVFDSDADKARVRQKREGMR
jgi:tetratricopeptide (TPR) repeat protein